jgi:hypothetical protein
VKYGLPNLCNGLKLRCGRPGGRLKRLRNPDVSDWVLDHLILQGNLILAHRKHRAPEVHDPCAILLPTLYGQGLQSAFDFPLRSSVVSEPIVSTEESTSG